MSKGIATRTIVLLLIGILAVGILIFLIYLYMPSEQISVYECRSRLTGVCVQCKNVNFGNIAIGTNLTDKCSQYNEFSGWSGINNCNNANTEYLCNMTGVT